MSKENVQKVLKELSEKKFSYSNFSISINHLKKNNFRLYLRSKEANESMNKFVELEPWLFWILYTLKKDLERDVQDLLEDLPLETETDYERLCLCKNELLSGNSRLAKWVSKKWLFQKKEIGQVCPEEALETFGPSNCYVYYVFQEIHNDLLPKLKNLALNELSDQKFIHVQKKLSSLEKQYLRDVELLRSKVQKLQDQLFACHGSESVR